jgi:hypothetical protein
MFRNQAVQGPSGDPELLGDQVDGAGVHTWDGTRPT